MLIDSHHHLWKYSAEEYDWIGDGMDALKKDFLAPELQQVSSESSVDGFVSVQARQSIVETDQLLKIASKESLIKGVVGWVPLADPMIEQVLEKYSDQKMLKGVRHVVQSEPDDRFILGAQFNRGISALAAHDLVYDVLIFAKQLPATNEFVRHHTSLPMVLDHIAKPTIDHPPGSVDKAWESEFRELAKAENVCCKFSGVVTEVRADTWDIDLIRPYFEVALEAFTPDRLMFGSDWPVCLLKSGYARWVETVQALAGELSSEEQSKIFSGNAKRFYSLD